MSRFELILDIVGINKDGKICHPFRGVRGEKKGSFSYTLSTTDNETFLPIGEDNLRRLIESGAFDTRGRVRMIPHDAVSTSGAGALSVVRYKGADLPFCA